MTSKHSNFLQSYYFLRLKLFTSYCRSLVMTFAMVFLMSCKLRDMLMTKPFELTFRELGDPSRLIRICSNISTGKFSRLLNF